MTFLQKPSEISFFNGQPTSFHPTTRGRRRRRRSSGGRHHKRPGPWGPGALGRSARREAELGVFFWGLRSIRFFPEREKRLGKPFYLFIYLFFEGGGDPFIFWSHRHADDWQLAIIAMACLACDHEKGYHWYYVTLRCQLG